MQPIEPRRYLKLYHAGITKEDYNENPLKSELPTKRDESFALYMHNMRTPKTFQTSDFIVIIGFNDLAKAFLRTLMFSWSSPE